MPVNWNLAQSAGGGFDYLESLKEIGNQAIQRQKQQEAQYRLAGLARQDAARPVVQQRVAAGDYRVAQAEAVNSGDFDFAKAIGGLAADERKAVDAATDYMGRVASGLKRVPMELRARLFQSTVPRFRALGLSEEQLAGVDDFSDDTLDYFANAAQSVRDQLAGQLTQTRIDDIGLDNERADMLAGNTVRNTQDVIADRAARRGLTARGQDMADARGRYGIGVASADRRRGQDISSGDRRRGQDMTDKRIRETGGRRAGGGKAVRVSTPEQARALPPGTVFVTPDGTRKVR